jgi:8-oxo-dGTP diphosphatase
VQYVHIKILPCRVLSLHMIFTPSVIGYQIQDNQVLLGLRKKVSTGMGQNLIAGIGGKLENSETHSEGLVREFQEEIKVTPTEYVELGRVRFLWPDKLKWSQDVKIYLITKWQGEPTETDVIKPHWYDINNLPLSQMWEDNSIWVPPSLKGEKVDYLFLIGSDNKIIAYE